MTKRWFHKQIVTAIAAVLACVVCSSATRAATDGLVFDGEQIATGAEIAQARQEGTVNVYSTFPTASLKTLSARFTADTGIAIQSIRLTSEQLYQRVVTEYSVHKLGADYIDIADLTLENQLAEQGILKSHKVPNFASLPSVLKDSQGRWYVLLRSAMGIAVNTAVVPAAETPTKWSDLLNPKWKGKIGFASIDAGGTAFSAFYFLYRKYGIDFWKKLLAQDPRIYPTAAPVASDLNCGEVSIAINPVTSTIDQIEAGSPLKFVFPSDGVPVFPVVGGVTSTAAHPHASEVFLNWLSSKRGAAVIASLGSYPIASHIVPTSVGATFPAESALVNLSLAQWETLRTPVTAQWHGVFGSR